MPKGKESSKEIIIQSDEKNSSEINKNINKMIKLFFNKVKFLLNDNKKIAYPWDLPTEQVIEKLCEEAITRASHAAEDERNHKIRISKKMKAALSCFLREIRRIIDTYGKEGYAPRGDYVALYDIYKKLAKNDQVAVLKFINNPAKPTGKSEVTTKSKASRSCHIKHSESILWNILFTLFRMASIWVLLVSYFGAGTKKQSDETVIDVQGNVSFIESCFYEIKNCTAFSVCRNYLTAGEGGSCQFEEFNFHGVSKKMYIFASMFMLIEFFKEIVMNALKFRDVGKSFIVTWVFSTFLLSFLGVVLPYFNLLDSVKEFVCGLCNQELPVSEVLSYLKEGPIRNSFFPNSLSLFPFMLVLFAFLTLSNVPNMKWVIDYFRRELGSAKPGKEQGDEFYYKIFESLNKELEPSQENQEDKKSIQVARGGVFGTSSKNIKITHNRQKKETTPLMAGSPSTSERTPSAEHPSIQ